MKNLTQEQVTKEIYDLTKKTITDVMDKHLYRNYNGQKFNATFNMDEMGKWIFPEYMYNPGYDPAYRYNNNTSNSINVIKMGLMLNDEKIGSFFHETNHGIQVFFGENFNQLGNKGYNDELVDVGRWFELNNEFVAYPYLTTIYGKNIRELDSFSINTGRTSKYRENKKNYERGGIK